jgi:chloramphenicol O-acetyltransferase
LINLIFAGRNGTIGLGHYQFWPRINEFVREASIELERVRQRDDIERYPEANLIRYSVLPWFDFTSISHARDFSREDSAPRITFGKITQAEGRRTMPVSIHVHHALVDGLHVAQFIEKFQHSWTLQTPNLRNDSSVSQRSYGNALEFSEVSVNGVSETNRELRTDRCSAPLRVT